MTAFHIRETCRLCGWAELSSPVVQLPDTAIANEYVADPSAPQDTFPLYLVECGHCGHVQLPVVIDPRRLFPANYAYSSSTSPIFVEHLHEFAAQVMETLPAPVPSVIEIGSNDGTFLKALQSLGARTLGIDPAANLAATATAAGQLTLPMFFDPQLASWLEPVDAIVSNNCLAHIDDLQGVARGIRSILKPGGHLVFEVGYLKDVVTSGIFDVIYHEHLSYHHLRPLEKFLMQYSISLYDAERVPSQGGSIRCWCYRGWRRKSRRLQELLADEERLDVASMQPKIFDIRDELRHELGDSFSVFGAPAKLTTLLAVVSGKPNAVYDDNPLKVGKFTPGTHAPIMHSSQLYDVNPETLLVASWNFADEIIPRIRRAGYRGKIVCPSNNFVKVQHGS